ncbi:hypothetical protein [uncultured Polaribacter sp.]|uniref:hypothetical protein n=1 Tax=uncultured Polaribacter sp. TaxID=174711 RepID=UPI002632686B|nr:hypothetical protein [uncultured Polaribacter sp.]
MRKRLPLLAILLAFISLQAQEKKKDTLIKPEVVNIETKYNPKIANVNKIKTNPKIELLHKTKKKKLDYTIFSAPVASTFLPKTGVVKGINVGVRERIYNNYLAAGYGNFNTPYGELQLYHHTRFNNEFGINAKYNASYQKIQNTILNSTFSNFNASAFYKKETRYFDWKITAETQLNSYNWYGLPEIDFTKNTINSIEEAQMYTYAKLENYFKVYDSYIDSAKINFSFFSDAFNSSEILANFNVNLNFPLDFISPKLNEISVATDLEYLKGFFSQNYSKTSSINYNQITARIDPSYTLNYLGLFLKAGVKTAISLDPENDANNVLVFPDILAKQVILKKHINLYGGITGNLHTNTYQEFAEENPFISPNLFITQTAETANYFLGLNGNITTSLNYNIKAAYKTEEDKPLFVRNNSKSNGVTNTFNNQVLKGYEFGNSFTVFYDDINTTQFTAEMEYFYNKNLTFSTGLEFNNYTVTNALDSYNLPDLQGVFLAKYKTQKWFATTNIFYVAARTDVLYNSEYPSAISSLQSLNAFVDVNLNGGYHFNDKFSAFLRLNNILNTNYQRFANFNVQGFQALGGFTYKFDF